MTQIVRETTPKLVNPNVIKHKWPSASSFSNEINLKVGYGTAYTASITSFWSFFSDSAQHNRYGTYSAISATTRTQLLSLTGVKGLLTSLVSPTSPTSATEVTFYVTVDGTEYIYKHLFDDDAHRVVYGGFTGGGHKHATDNSTNSGGGVGSYLDVGMRLSGGVQFGILNPQQTTFLGIGIPFNDSLIVEVEMSVANTTAINNNAGVLYAKYN